jgi:hypothetical protein
MKVDASRSKIAIYTYTEGLFSRLAHDLELEVRSLIGDVTNDACTLRIAVSEIRVVGGVKRGKVDANVLSNADREAIEEQIRENVFRGGTGEIVVTGTRDGAKARIAIAAPTGRAEVVCSVNVKDGERATGEVVISLRGIGVAPVKGPLGAFRLADRVKVAFEIAGG